MLTRSGYIVNNPPPEIKKELTVRAIVNDDFGFPPPLSRYLDQLRMESAFQDITELVNWENPRKIRDLCLHEFLPDSMELSGTPPIRTPHLQRLLTQVTGSSVYRAGSGRPPFH